MKRIIFILLCCLATIAAGKAQNLGDILLAADDAGKLTENYISPAMKGLMYSMNGGWYSTAKTHKKFGFDLTIGINASLVPDEAQSFAFVQGDYSFLTLPNGESELQTVMSENDAETTVYDGTENAAPEN